MKITIESTTKIVTVNGFECRVWEGETASGIQVQALVPIIAVKRDQDQTQFEAELAQKRAPTEDFNAFPLRMVL